MLFRLTAAPAIWVIGNTFEEHCGHVGEVFSRFLAAGLKLKTSKCHIFQTKVDYLGHVVCREGVSTNSDKESVINDWPVLRNLTDLQPFLGTVGFLPTVREEICCQGSTTDQIK